MFSTRGRKYFAQRRCRISLSFNFRVWRNDARNLVSLTLTPWFAAVLVVFYRAWNLNVPIDGRSLFSLLLETRQVSRVTGTTVKLEKILKIPVRTNASLRHFFESRNVDFVQNDPRLNKFTVSLLTPSYFISPFLISLRAKQDWLVIVVSLIVPQQILLEILQFDWKLNTILFLLKEIFPFLKSEVVVCFRKSNFSDRNLYTSILFH